MERGIFSPSPTRRRILVALGAGTLATPLSPFAQQPAGIRRIGVLTVRPRPNASDREDVYNEFVAALRDLGYVEGKNVAFEWRSSGGTYERLADEAAKLVALHPDVILATATPATDAAKRATSTIPIVSVSVADPVASGFAASLARPGGNITGLTNITADLSVKLVDLLKTVKPRLKRLGVLTNSANSTHPIFWKNIQASARKLGIQAIQASVATPEQIQQAFSALARDRAEALLIASDAIFTNHREKIARLALDRKLPTVFPFRQDVIAGGLMSYGSDLGDMFRRAATFVDKILKGAEPSQLPFEQPAQFELAVNLRTAKALGLTFSQSILARADRVVE